MGFAEELLQSVGLKTGSVVLDPWNGAGTTVLAARGKYRCYGYDLNPAMVLVARAALLPPEILPSVRPLARTLAGTELRALSATDPLLTWLKPAGAAVLRSIESGVRYGLIDHKAGLDSDVGKLVDQATPLAAFFYVALFRAARSVLRDFIPSNPTWVREPKDKAHRIQKNAADIRAAFLHEVEKLSELVAAAEPGSYGGSSPVVQRGDATRIPLGDHTVDCTLTSPPYCTRIDYAVATSIELAVLAASPESFDQLRRALMGTSTVPKTAPETNELWGPTCLKFLKDVRTHGSKASATYYTKNHLAYFDALYKALSELRRVTRPGGMCFIVVQDSYYKNIHNDLQQIIVEMMNGKFECFERHDFKIKMSMASVNSRARAHLGDRVNVESVLCFRG